MLCAEDRIDTAFFSSGPGSQCGMIHNDHLATPQKMTDGSGAVVWSADYKPFGEATVTISTITNNLRFPGQYFDFETGLLYNMNRTYDKDLGRYIETDPIGLGGGINIYAYAFNNPVMKKDPTGLKVAICTESKFPFHSYILLNGSGTGFYPRGSIFGSQGFMDKDDNKPGDVCFPVTPPCGKEQDFEQCVQNELSAPCQPTYSIFGSNCYNRATRIVNKCYRKMLFGF
jgi:RHS repeat-associated protein